MAAALVVLVVLGDGLIDRAGAGSTSVQDSAVAALAPGTLDGLVPPRQPRPAPPLTEPTCTGAPELTCFLWTVEAEGAGFDTVTVADGLLITEEALAGALVARSIADGTPVWEAALGRGFSAGMLRVVDDLLLHTEVRDLVARDLATGRERWRTDALDHHAPYEVHLDGDLLVVAGVSHRRTGYGGGPPNAIAAGLDPDTGDVRWLEEANEASLGAGGVAVLSSRDGYLRAYEPTGELRWRSAEPLAEDEVGVAGVSGHVVVLYDEDGRSPLHRLSDGAALDLDGEILGSDDEHTFVELHPRGGADDGGLVEFALFDDDGEVWRTGGLGGSCLSHAEFTPTTVELVTCSASRITLDRADGTTVLRPVRSSTPLGNVDGPNPYVAWTTPEVRGVVSSLVLSDARSASEVARLPPASQLVTHGPDGSEDLGGVVIWRSQHWLTAFALPGGTEATPGVGTTGSVVWPARRGWR